MKLADRIQTKLADRLSSVQYPHIRSADDQTRKASRTGLQFKYSMPLGKRFDLFIMSSFLLVAGLLGLGAVILFIYCLI